MRALFIPLLTAAGALVWVGGPVAQQPVARAAAKPATWSVPRTPWGDPDLQGTWTSDDMRGVPTVRPQQFGDRLYLTDQEFADRKKRDEQARLERAHPPQAAADSPEHNSV